MQTHRKLSVQAKARHRDAVKSAIMTEIRPSLVGNLSREQSFAEELHYVRTFVPNGCKLW